MSPSAISPWIWNTPKDSDSPHSLGSLCQLLTALLEKKFFLMSNLRCPTELYPAIPAVFFLPIWLSRQADHNVLMNFVVESIPCSHHPQK